MFMSVILICGLPNAWDGVRESCALTNSQQVYLTEQECYEATIQPYLNTLEILAVRGVRDALVTPQCIKLEGGPTY